MITLEVLDKLSKFEVKRVTQLKTAPAVVYELEHSTNGARVVHYACDDPENLFSISFPTPPSDDTGLPHIMEHSVLSGSSKFRLKDPFFAMAKVSMATFLNAMTGGDCTYYPVASNVRQDIFNLADVYFDAVFHPLLSKDTFDREAHHLSPVDPKTPNGDLTVRGVVYNEMLAHAADPGYRLWYKPLVNLLKGTIYVYESGGDPNAIPDLTFEDFNQFHKTFYQPANAHFFIYGDIPTSEWMEFLEERMTGLVPAQIPEAVYTPERWTEPLTISDSYPIGDSEPDTQRTYFAKFWLAGNALDPVERILLKLLSTILIGNDAAPLKKVVVDSKLGSGLAIAGEYNVGPQVVFSVGLKGSEPDRGDKFESLVMDTLLTIAREGIDEELINAAFQQVSYSDLEISSGYPLSRMHRVVPVWIHGDDPVTFLEAAAHLEKCRGIVENNPEIFCQLIRERLLDNKHRLFHTLTPDREWQKRQEEGRLNRMRRLRESMSDAQVAEVAERATALERLSGAPDSAEALASLPHLQIKDLPDSPRSIRVEWDAPSDMLQLGRNDVFANGINYLELAIDMSGLPIELWQYVPRFCQAFCSMGTKDADYVETARRKAAHTGGLSLNHRILTSVRDGAGVIPCLVVQLKTLDGHMKHGLDIIGDLLYGLNPLDIDRLSTVTQNALTDARKGTVQNAMQTATVHAERNISVRGHLNYLINGLHQLRLLEGLCRNGDNRIEILAGHIEAIRDHIIAHGTITAGFTGSDESFEAARDRILSWATSRNAAPATDIPVPVSAPVREGLAGAIDISYCASTLTTIPMTYPESPLLELGAHLVSHDYMLQEVRIKGTAYGAGFRYKPHDSELQIYSYRDPQIARTLSVVNAIPEYVKSVDWTKNDIEQAAIAVAKTYLKPVRPASATTETLNQKLIGWSDELRDARFARIRSAEPGEVKRAVLDTLETGLSSAPVCVVSNRSKLQEANQKLRTAPLVIEDIL